MLRKFWLLGVVALAGCAGGGVLALFDPAPLVGNYAGNWQNLTFSTTGTATMALTTNTGAKTARMVLDLNGSVFGGADPAAVTMNGTYDDFQMTVSANTALFGQITFTVDGNGNFTGTAPNVPGATVDSMTFTGTITSTGANLTYFLALAGGGSANGTLVLAK